MKVTPIYATVTAAILMFGAGNALRADDGGKGPGPNSGNNNATQIRLRTNLTGGKLTGITPEGNADFRSETGRMRLSVEVENVNLPNGTVLTVAVVHAGVSTTVGTITLNSASNENELELDSQHGDTVPAIVAGDMVTVSAVTAVNTPATMILAGVFQ